MVSFEQENYGGDPKFVPDVNQFYLGGELLVLNYAFINLGIRNILNIPYTNLSGQQSRASANMWDLSVRSKKLWKRFEIGFLCLQSL